MQSAQHNGSQGLEYLRVALTKVEFRPEPHLTCRTNLRGTGLRRFRLPNRALLRTQSARQRVFADRRPREQSFGRLTRAGFFLEWYAACLQLHPETMSRHALFLTCPPARDDHPVRYQTRLRQIAQEIIVPRSRTQRGPLPVDSSYGANARRLLCQRLLAQ